MLIPEEFNDSAEAEARSRVYRLLAAIFEKEVGIELLGLLASNEMSAALADLGIGFGRIIPLKEDARASFADELAEEYAALFVTPGGISPYESVSIKGLLCQEPEWEVREFYKRCGLKLKNESRVFADHLSLELDFMAFMAGKEARALVSNNGQEGLAWKTLEQEFFTSHINRWVFGFLDDLERFTAHPFYKEASTLTRKFLEIERDDLVEGMF